MIRLNNLYFRYPEGEFSLRIPDLAVERGETVAVIGPIGSGKTTLLHLIAGIAVPLTGRVVMNNVEVTQLGDGARRDFRISNIGLVFQEFELLEYLTVLDNILLPYRINRSLRLDAPVRRRAHQLAAEMGLAEFLSRPPTHLSHGERQRVAVCRALIANPKLVLADEPTANLDADNASRVLDALDHHAKHQEATLVVVTHDQGVPARFDRTIDISSFCNHLQATDGGGSGDER